MTNICESPVAIVTLGYSRSGDTKDEVDEDLDPNIETKIKRNKNKLLQILDWSTSRRKLSVLNV